MTPEHPNAVYAWSRAVILAIYREFYCGAISGLENIPRSGGCILASNHASHLDPPILGCNISRPIAFFARKTLWKPGFPSWWLDTVGAIPVDRGSSDLGAFKRVIATLQRGAVISLFPEGTRSKDGLLQPAKPGIGMIAAKSQATVVPCRIFGSQKALGRDAKLPRVNFPIPIAYGAPMPPQEYDPGEKADRKRYQIIADRIMARISALEKPRSVEV